MDGVKWRNGDGLGLDFEVVRETRKAVYNLSRCLSCIIRGLGSLSAFGFCAWSNTWVGDLGLGDTLHGTAC
jgi:hypothetical protein